MKEITNNEMTKIVGGAINGVILSAIVKGIEAIFTIGQHTGSALRRIKSDDLCPLN